LYLLVQSADAGFAFIRRALRLPAAVQARGHAFGGVFRREAGLVKD